jgi:hypothetical protein
MLKNSKNRKHKDIDGLATQCEAMEQLVHDSITEILKLVDSINEDLEEELKAEENGKAHLEVINEKQAEAS